jgi:hypothetical protein
MLAAWDSAANGAQVPWALELYFSCQNYNALPRAGGILDQDSYEMIAMDRTAFAYYAAKKPMKDQTADEQSLRIMLDVYRLIHRGKPADVIRNQLKKLSPGLLQEDGVNTAVAERLGLSMIVSDIWGVLYA